MNVVDANVVLSGVRCRNGASHLVLRGMLTGHVPVAASSAVVMEYEDLLKRPGRLGLRPWLALSQIDQLLDALCAKAVLVLPWFRFRPFLNDPKDDLYIECALSAGARMFVTGDRHVRHPAVTTFVLKAETSAECASRLNLTRSQP